jgi:hypothetical protein
VHAHLTAYLLNGSGTEQLEGVRSVVNGDLQGPNYSLMNQEESPVHSDVGYPVFSTKWFK